MMPAVGVVYRGPAVTVIVQNHHHMMRVTADRSHPGAGLSTGKPQPISGEPKRPTRLSEYPQGRPAAAERHPRAAGRVGNDLSPIVDASNGPPMMLASVSHA